MKYTITISIYLVACCLLFGQDSTNTDFDFYYGQWEVQNKRQMEDGSWTNFSAWVEATKTLHGQGNVDVFQAVVDGKPFAGMSVRLFDPVSKSWQIRWYDTEKINLDPKPSIGQFKNGEGKFYKTITTPGGREVSVRFHWSNITKDSFHWESSWSIDDKNWTPTWIMDFKRIK